MKTFKCHNTACNLPVAYDEDAIGEAGLSVKCPICQRSHQLKAKKPLPKDPPMRMEAPAPAVSNAVEPDDDNTFYEDTGYLIAQDGSQQKWDLKIGINVIGRSTATTIQPDWALTTQDLRISKRHCVVEVVQTAYGIKHRLYDIGILDSKGSKNGTFLKTKILSTRAADGTMVFPIAALVHDDVFRIGNTPILLQVVKSKLPKFGAGGTILNL